MNRNENAKWDDIYKIWKMEIDSFPELCGQLRYLSVGFSKPEYGRCNYYNWVSKGNEEKAVQTDLSVLASSWPEIGEGWSKGTIHTVALLTGCESEEERAAVWIAAFALTLIRRGNDRSTTFRNAWEIENEARKIFAHKYYYWHTSSRDFFPEFYIPATLLWDSKELSISNLVKLAVINAALVMTHYTPVEYERTHD